MRKLLLALALSFSLVGCTTVQQGIDAVGNAFTPVKQPITTQVLYDFENGMIVAFAGLNAYKAGCVQKVLPQSCRMVVASLQTYTRRLPAALARVRAFVKTNDQVNAVQAYSELKALYTEFIGVAQANGVKTQ